MSFIYNSVDFIKLKSINQSSFVGLTLDYGLKRIGLAVSNKECSFASSLGIINNDDFLILKLINLIKDYSVKFLLFGLPVKMDGSSLHDISGDMFRFLFNLQDLLQKLDPIFSYLPTFLFDERMTSSYFEKDVKIKKNKKLFFKNKNIDDLSAILIFNSFIDSVSVK